MVIALTGVFGSGKSTVLEQFRRAGARVLSADELVHRLLCRPSVAAEIRRIFGPGVFCPDGPVNRRALAHRVFARPADRRRLEKLLHPKVDRLIARAARGTAAGDLLVVEVPLFHESRLTGVYDLVVCVSASREAIVRRLRRRGFSDAEISRRAAAQLPLPEKEKRSDFVINNDGSPADTERQVSDLLARLKP